MKGNSKNEQQTKQTKITPGFVIALIFLVLTIIFVAMFLIKVFNTSVIDTPSSQQMMRGYLQDNPEASKEQADELRNKLESNE